MTVSRRSRALAGFTLIELLITITIFAGAVAALVAGLRGGIHTWRLVRAHQVRDAEVSVALDRLADDFRHIAIVEKDKPPFPLVGVASEDGLDSVTITRRTSRRDQRLSQYAKSLDTGNRQVGQDAEGAGLRGEWALVTYEVLRADGGGGMNLVRTCEDKVAESSMGGPVETVVLAGIKSLRFLYLTPEGPVTGWEQGQNLPSFVQMVCQRVRGGTISKTFWLPAGALGKTG